MKKLVFIFIVAFSIIQFVSCTDKELEVTSEKEIEFIDLPFAATNDNGILNFETQTDYELALNYLAKLEFEGNLSEFEKSLSFESYRSVFSDNVQKMEDIQDDILASFLNPDNQVIIGGRLFEISLVDDRVSVWEYQGCELKSTSNERLIANFRCDDDVFGILEEGTITKSVNATTCPARKYGVTQRIEMVDQDQFLTYYDYYVQYIKGGIYYTLNARIRCQLTKTVLTIDSDLGTYRKIRNSSNDTIDAHFESGKNWERNYRAYWGTKRLESYNFPVTFSASTTTTIKTDEVEAGVTEDIFEALVTGTCIDE